MKTRFLTAIGLLTFFLLCLVPNGGAQSCFPFTPNNSSQSTVALKCPFTASSAPYSFNAGGAVYWSVVFVPSGTISAATLSLDSSPTGLSWTTGGVIAAATIGSMTSASSYSNSTATTPTNYAQLTPTISGTGTVTVYVFGYLQNPSSSGSVSGTVTANAGTGNFNNSSIGTTGSAVPGSSTVVAGKNTSGNAQDISTDTSGNVGVNIQNTTATSGATNITASQCAVVAVGGSSQVAVFVSGTWTGTLQPKVSLDGTTYVNALVFASFPTGSSASTVTANGQWVLLPFGANSAEVCGNTVTSGTAVVTVNATPGVGEVLDNVSLWGGSLLGAPSNYGTSPGAVLVPGVNAYVTNTPAVTQSGTWSTRISGNTGVALDSAAGVTAPTNGLQISGVYNSAAPAPTTGQAEPLQLDSSGDLYVAFRSTTNGCAGNNSSFASLAVNFSGTALTQVIALSAGKKIYICAAYLQGGGTSPTLEFEYGTGTNCGSGTTILTQAVSLTTAAPGISWSSPGPVVPVGDALCYILTGTSPTVVGWLSYVQ